MVALLVHRFKDCLGDGRCRRVRLLFHIIRGDADHGRLVQIVELFHFFVPASSTAAGSGVFVAFSFDAADGVGAVDVTAKVAANATATATDRIARRIRICFEPRFLGGGIKLDIFVHKPFYHSRNEGQAKSDKNVQNN